MQLIGSFINVIVSSLLCLIIFQIPSVLSISIYTNNIASYDNNIISKEVIGHICYHTECQKSILKNKMSSMIKLKTKLLNKSKILRIAGVGDSILQGNISKEIEIVFNMFIYV